MKILYIFMLIFSFFIISCSSFKYPCYMNKVFSDDSFYEKKYLFSSHGRDTDRICSFSLNKKLISYSSGFQNLDKKYSKEMIRVMNFLEWDIENWEKYQEYTLEKVNTLKNVIKEIKRLEKLKDTKYKYFLLEKGLSDDELCIYNKTENKWYCIVIHM